MQSSAKANWQTAETYRIVCHGRHLEQSKSMQTESHALGRLHVPDLVLCNAGVHASVLTAPCSLSSTQVSAHVHACLTLWMTVLLCTCCKHQVCLVQDTQSSSQAPAVPMLKPRESPLRWSNTNPQVSPTFVHTAQL